MSFQVLCDVHIALKVVRFFQSKGCHAVHVNDILDGYYTSDGKISDYADANGYTVVTKDADFRNSHFIKGSPGKLLKIALGNIPTPKLISILEFHFDAIEVAFQNESCYVEIGNEYIEVIPGPPFG